MTNDDALYMWTVYDHPTDIPDKYVARKFKVGREGTTATNTIVTEDTLDGVRNAMMSRGLTCLMRDPNDDPRIIEVWL